MRFAIYSFFMLLAGIVLGCAGGSDDIRATATEDEVRELEAAQQRVNAEELARQQNHR